MNKLRRRTNDKEKSIQTLKIGLEELKIQTQRQTNEHLKEITVAINQLTEAVQNMK